MPLIRGDDLVRIDLPAEGEWVDVKRRLSRGDEIAVQRSAVGHQRVRPNGGVDGIEIELGQAIEAAEFAVMEVAIKRWSFDEPVTPDAIRLLDAESVEVIKAKLNELYPARSDDERKNSRESGATPSSNEAPSLMSSDG